MTVIHYATCAGWKSGDMDDCTCFEPRAWRIRKEPFELFAWRIWRRTNDGAYEHVMRCSTWAGAMSLIDQFMWLRRVAAQAQLGQWTQNRLSLGDRDV